MNYKLHKTLVSATKKVFGIHSLKLFVRKKRQLVERLFYHKKYTARELVDELVRMGMKPGSVVIVQCAMNNFYNYRGTVDELIDELLRVLGPEGTLCMPAFPFDKHSPFYKIYELGGLAVSLGLRKAYYSICSHVPETLLYDEIGFFHDKFTTPVTFRYIDQDGNSLTHTMLTKSKTPYIVKYSKKFMDDNFDHSKYAIKRFSNLWLNVHDVRTLIDTLTRLGREGKTIYSYPKFYR